MEMDPWRRNIYQEKSNKIVSTSLTWTDHEKSAIEGLFLLHKDLPLKLSERTGDVQNKMIFSSNEIIIDNPIIENKKESKLKDIQWYKRKTRNKRVASFQAFNDHQTSHKKLKITEKKIHKCWICGIEFFSGQALGGHMRKHRTVTQYLIRNSPQSAQSSKSFSLDLNLPAIYESDLLEPTNSSSCTWTSQ